MLVPVSACISIFTAGVSTTTQYLLVLPLPILASVVIPLHYTDLLLSSPLLVTQVQRLADIYC